MSDSKSRARLLKLAAEEGIGAIFVAKHMHSNPEYTVALAQRRARLAAHLAFLAHPELRDPATPYGSCSGCEKPDGVVSTHYEGTYQHPLRITRPGSLK